MVKSFRAVNKIDPEQSMSLLRATLESTADGILVVDREGAITTFNQRFVDLWGIPARVLSSGDDQEALTFVLHQLKNPADFLDKVMALYVTPDAESFDVLEFKDGRIFERYSRPQRVGGDSVGRVWSFRDITERKRAETARAHMAAIVENSQDAVVSRSLDGTILTWNAGAERMFGYSAAEARGQDIFSLLVPPERRSEVQPKRALVDQGIPTSPYDSVRLTKSGRRIDVSIMPSPIYDANRTLSGISIVFRDINDRRHAEEARAQLAAIVENASDAIFSRTLDGTILSWNAGAERMFGYTASEAIGQHTEILLPSTEGNLLARNTEQLLRGEHIAPRETQRVTKGGQMVDVTTSLSPIRNRAGDVIGASIILRDNSALKKAAAAILESEERFRAAFEQAEVGMALRGIDSRNTRWLRVNQKLCDILGYTREEMLRLSTLDITPPEEHAIATEYSERLQRGEITSYSREKHYVRKDGQIIWVNVTLSAVNGPDGNPTHAISVIQDISERKAADQQLREYLQRLRLLSRRLFEVEEDSRRGLARELHDRLGQNVTALALNLNMIRSDLPEDSLRKVLARIDDCESLLSTSGQIIRDVMADLRPPGLDELGLLAALNHHARQMAGRTGLAIAVKGEPLAPRLPPDTEATLFRIAQEALTNVAKHAHATEIVITLDTGPERAILTIADDGRGYRLPARFEHATTSLGMVNMRERAEAIGAQLRVESSLGQGARVIVEVPSTVQVPPIQPQPPEMDRQ